MLHDFLLRIGTAVLLGIFIGVERQLTGHPAGVRINTLVSLGSCIFCYMYGTGGDVNQRKNNDLCIGQ